MTATATAAPTIDVELLVLGAPVAGWAASLDEVDDPVFGQRMLGDGVAIDPLAEALHAPCDGVVVNLPPSRHALTLRAANGAEILMHLGLDTVALGGEGFRAHVAPGEAVARGQLLLSFDMDDVGRRAKSLITPILVTNGDAFEIVRRVTGRTVAMGEAVLALRKVVETARAEAAGGPAAGAELRIDLPHGLHARPAARLAAVMKPFRARVTLRLEGREADLRSAVSVMALGAARGSLVSAWAEGDDAEAALGALRATLSMLAAEEAAHVAPAPAPADRPETPPGGTPGVLRGVCAAPGLAIGVLMRLHVAEPVVRVDAESPDAEQRRLSDALSQVAGALRARAAGGDPHRRGILEAHEAFLSDPELRARAGRGVAAGLSAGVAWREAVRAQVAVLRGLSDPRMAQRADDLVDLERQVLLALSGETTATPMLPVGAIVAADELLPSELLALEGAQLGGICTARGGATSHVAILAAAMGIPALCALGPALLETRRGVTVILDADAGVLQVAPDSETLASAQADLARRAERGRLEQAAANDSARLADGTRIEVCANLGAAGEAAGAVASGAEGCGLFRTEFLYLDRQVAPTQAEQRATYQAAADGLAGRPLTIRTLDAGGDKPLAFAAPAPHEPNPALGLRGLRASFRQPTLFRDQVAAILQVAGPGERRILLPMVTDLADVVAARDLVSDVARDLGCAPAKLGVMIETPASALVADQLAAVADFLSVGTNDLTQYVLAVDREHPELAPRLDGLHPAVLRLIRQVTRAAAPHGAPVGVCGGLASDPIAAPVLVGLGVSSLSAAPSAVPAVKARLRTLPLAECQALAEAAVMLTSAGAVRAMLAERLLDNGAAA